MGNDKNAGVKKTVYKKTNIFVYMVLILASWLAGFIFRAKTAEREKLKAVRAIKGPVLVIGTHQSPIDFLFLTRALFPRRLGFVMAANLYYDKQFAWALKMMRNAIPKKQFSADFECVKSIKKMIENGISVALYPEGRVSVDGTQSYVGANIAKLIKWLNVPVVLVKDYGAYLSMPKYSLKFHIGKVKVLTQQIFSQEQTQTLSAADIHQILLQEFQYNEFEYQQREHIAFSGKNPAFGLDRLLYKCPKCGTEFKMVSEKDILMCAACGNAAKIDKYGTITAKADGVCYSRVDLWYRFQKEELSKEIETAEEFSLQCEVGLALNDEKSGGFISVEQGMLTLTKQGYQYDGEDGRSLSFSIASSPSIAFVIGTSIDFFRDNTIYRFCFDKVYMSTKYNIATELLHKKYYKD